MYGSCNGHGSQGMHRVQSILPFWLGYASCWPTTLWKFQCKIEREKKLQFIEKIVVPVCFAHPFSRLLITEVVFLAPKA